MQSRRRINSRLEERQTAYGPMQEQPLPPVNPSPFAAEPDSAQGAAPVAAQDAVAPEIEPGPPPAPQQPADDLTTALLRLLVGGALEGSEQISQRLQQWQAEAQPGAPDTAGAGPTGQPVLRSLVVGALFSAHRSARRRLGKATLLASSAAQAGFSLLKPLARHTPLHPLHQRFERLVQRGQAEIDQWVRQGQVEELHSRRMLQRSVHGTLGEAIGLLSNSDQVSQLIKDQIGALAADLPHTPQVDALVQKLIKNVVAYLEANPAELELLVRSQGDHYMDYLSENPAQVQEIVQGQSTSMADEMSDEVRERMVTADNVFELFVRSLLRRPLREELPPPQSEIRQRALRARLRDELSGAHSPTNRPKGS